jgi:iron complex outermembrane receptor protein
MKFNRVLVRGALSAAVAAMAVPALAQIEEIVVTARKSEESLQQTPVAVTALSETMLAEAQVVEIADLQRTAPNLSIMTGGTGSSALVFMSIRGNAQTSPSGGTDPAVGVYVDGVYLARPTGGNVDMFDVAQAEVLRGPQGTLFGRNTTGGALNIKTNDPTGEFEGWGKVDIGNYDSRRYEGVVNLPIKGEELAARVAYRYNEHDGYGKYRGYNDPNGYSYDGLGQDAAEVHENMYGRAKLRWEPADLNFVATLGVDWSEFRDSGQRTQVKAINDSGIAGFMFSALGFSPDHFIRQQKYGDSYWNNDSSSINPDVYNDGRLNNPKSTNKTSGAFLDLEIDLGNDYVLKSISAYREITSSGSVDLDGTPVNLLSFASRWDQEQWSQEFQLSGTYGDNLDWITGVYYFEENSADFAVNRFGGDLGVALGQIGQPLETVVFPGAGALSALSTNDAVLNNRSFGAFFQANYQFTDALRGTLGVRYTMDKRDKMIRSENPESGQIGAVSPDNCKVPVAARDNPAICAQTDSVDYEYPAWVLGLDYQVSDNLFLYAKTSGASMAGGWNFRDFDTPSFEPENVMDVEVGFKSDLFDDRVRLNGAFFYMKADDQQRIVNTYVQETNSLVQYVRNAGKSTTYGAEFELTLMPWDGMVITSSLALLESEYDSYTSQERITTGPNAGQIVKLDRSGENPVHAPEMTFSLGATQTFYTGLGELDLHASYYWVDKTWFQDNTVNPLEGAEMQQMQREEKRWNALPDYSLVNALATLRLEGGQWELSLWGKNLTDEKYYTNVLNYYNANFNTASWAMGDPRTYGASVKYIW